MRLHHRPHEITSQPASLVHYSVVLQEFKTAPAGKLFCLHGDRNVFRLSLYAVSHALLAGLPIVLVDGTNRFDVYYIAEFARRASAYKSAEQRKTPEQLLENIFISRAFTCYQMEATITERLPAFLKKKKSSIVIIFGLLDTFYDDQAPLFEVKASVQRVIASLQNLRRQNVSVLLASVDVKLESKERNRLFTSLVRAMDEVFSMKENFQLVREVPVHGDGNKTLTKTR